MAGFPEGQPRQIEFRKPDGSLYSRIEMETQVKNNWHKIQWLRVKTHELYGLPNLQVYKMVEVVIRHWLLDEMVRRGQIVGPQLGVSVDNHEDDSEKRQFTQKLKALIDAGQALVPKEGEGIDMTNFQNPPPPPMPPGPQNGQPGQPVPTQGFTPPPPPPMGVPMGAPPMPPQMGAPPGYPPQPQQYAQQPPPPPIAPPGYPPQYAQTPAPQQAPSMTPPGYPPPPPPQQVAPPPPPAPPQAAPAAGGRGRGKRGAAADQSGAAPVPPAMPVPMPGQQPFPGVPQAPPGFAPLPMQPPSQAQQSFPGAQVPPAAPSAEIAELRGAISQLMQVLQAQGQQVANMSALLQRVSMGVALSGRVLWQKDTPNPAARPDISAFLSDLGVTIP